MGIISGKKLAVAAAILATMVTISAIIDISRTYDERKRLRSELSVAIQDNRVMHERFDAMQDKLKAREDENKRISESLAQQKVKLDRALQQNRVWSSGSVPNNVVNGLRAIVTDKD